MNYILVIVIYSILTPGIYSKMEVKTWPLSEEVCLILAKKALEDPALNTKTKYVASAKCDVVLPKRKFFPQTET